MNDAKTSYHRNLPHWHPPGAAMFLTCRLYGSLPEKAIQQKEAQGLVEREIHKAKESAEKIAELKVNPREANCILKRTGEKFWQQESFDHWPRDENEFFRIIQYIENNPVKAGLAQRPEEWRWSSAAERKRRGWNEIRALT